MYVWVLLKNMWGHILAPYKFQGISKGEGALDVQLTSQFSGP